MAEPFREVIARLIETCQDAQREGVSQREILNHVLVEEINRLLSEIAPADLLAWLREDREYSYYYYDAQESGACAKPREAAAMILESIARDAIE